MRQEDSSQGKGGRLLFRYIRHHRKSLLLLGMSVMIFFLVFLAYRLEWEAVWYAGALCMVLGLVAALLDLYYYSRRHHQMCQMANPIKINENFDGRQAAGEELVTSYMLPDSRLLPQPQNLIEEDYQSLIEALLQERSLLLQEYSRRKQERTDYETMWAHQIKTPIAAMRLLLQEQDIPEFRELSSELFQIEQYVEMILNYMRLDSPSNDFVFRKCDLDDMIKQAIRKYAAQFVRRKVALSREDTHAEVVTDEKWLVFVLEQLISNALKYTSAGEILIYQADAPVENSIQAQKVLLVIRDSGIGIAAEDLPRIFEKGYTGLNGRTGEKSTGIGLYLCKRILDKLGTRIWVESKPGNGTKVYLELERYLSTL